MPWGVAAAVAGGVASAGASKLLSGGKGGGNAGSGGSQESSNAPWSAQQPYLTQGFNNANGIYGTRTAQGPYQGSYYSPINQFQQDAANSGYGYAAGNGVVMPNTTAQTANTLQSAAPSFVGNATSLAANGIGGQNRALTDVQQAYATGAMRPQGVSSDLSGALNTAAISGANAIGSGQQNLAAASQRALADPTQGTVNAANTYANNPALEAQIRAAEQPVLQTLHEQTVPGLNRAASMGGNLNSSRAGMAEAMANRDAATQVGNIEGSMRGAAYQNGLNLAAQQREAGTNAAISAGTSQASTGANAALGTGNQQLAQGSLNSSTQLGAANAGLTQGLAAEGLNANTILAANAQLGSGVGTGVNAGTAAGTQAGQNMALANTAGSIYQNDQNAQLANQYQQWQQQNGYQQGVLADYMKAITGNYGSQGSTTNTLPPNTLGNTIGTGVAGASLFAPGGALNGAFSGFSGNGAGFGAGVAGSPVGDALISANGYANGTGGVGSLGTFGLPSVSGINS